MKRLISFIVDVDSDDYDYDEVREKVGGGEAELYGDEDASWAE